MKMAKNQLQWRGPRPASRRAAKHGRSMEEEVRAILRSAARESGRPASALGTRVAARFADAGLSVELPELRGQLVRPVDFSK